MAGQSFIVKGDPVVARNTIYTVLINQGFKLTQVDDWSARAERGSEGASIAFGSLTGKAGRYVKLYIACQSSQDGIVITLTQGTSGMSGGVIGVGQAEKLYTDVYNIASEAFQNAGVLISSRKI